MMFSDESTLQFVVRQHYARRPPGERDDGKYTIQTIEHPPSICVSRTIGLCFLNPGTILNGQMHLELLQNNL